MVAQDNSGWDLFSFCFLNLSQHISSFGTRMRAIMAKGLWMVLMVLSCIKFFVLLIWKDVYKKYRAFCSICSILTGITSLYKPIEEALEEPENIDNSERIPDALEVHKIGCTFSTYGICKMEFYYIAVDVNHFMSSGTRTMGIQMFLVTQNFHYRTILILHVLSIKELIKQIKNGWNATYEINGFMKTVFFFNNSFFNLFSLVLKVWWQIVLILVTLWQTDVLCLGSSRKTLIMMFWNKPMGYNAINSRK